MGEPRVIDSHIHIFGKRQLHQIRWMTKDSSLYGNNRLDEFLEVTDSQGVIVIEADFNTDIQEKRWDMAIEEYLMIDRVINGVQAEGEGFANGQYIRGIVPWAPVPLGQHGLKKYIQELRESGTDEAFEKIVGFRYLLQDKPPGVMLKDDFIEGFHWLGENNYTFDLGIDMHSGGLWQLEEWYKVDKATNGVTVIVNHLTKPNFFIREEEFKRIHEIWKAISLTTRNKYYIKLSGAFSELPDEIKEGDPNVVAQLVKPWLKLFVDYFGEDRIIWGSNWPVCRIEKGNAWRKWQIVSNQLINELGLSSKVYGNAASAYNLLN